MVTLERTRVDVETAHRYARDVLGGAVVAGPYVRAAAARHLRDLEHGSERGLTFDPDAANHALRFISLLNLADDEPFVLEPFQVFMTASLFGWYREDGHRRFRRAYIELGKGGGKTPWAAAIGLYGLCADGQASPEIYSAATTRTQAHILFSDAKRMVKSTPALTKIAEVLTHNITVGYGLFRPIDGSGKAISGPRVHVGLVDELHEHRTSDVVEILRAGTKRNLDALILEITNSGAGRTGPCWEDHAYSINVVTGVFEDDSWFGFVAGLDDGDDWRDESVWLKANPGLDTILPRVYVQEQVREAVNKPAKENLVKRLNFCIWTEQLERWLSMDLWDACNGAVDLEALKGQRCFGGLDLASRRDFTAFVLYFPETKAVLARFWVPKDMTIRTGQERERIEEWARAGLVTLTPGNITDYDVVRQDIEELAREYQVEEIGYDQWNATQLATQLQQGGATVVPMQQGGAAMSEASKELEALVAGGSLKLAGNPILRWMASNVAANVDRQGNVKLDRESSGDRIDGIVGLVEALARAMVHQEADSGSQIFV